MTDVGTLNESFRANWVRGNLQIIPDGQRILDVGAGEQQYKKFCSHLQYVSQDFAQYDGEGDSKGLHTGEWKQQEIDIVSDIIAIPEPASSFDAILCVEVLEHLPDPLKALEEISRLLPSGGRLLLTAAFSSLTHFAPFHFFSGFSRYFYEQTLPQYGFEIESLQINGNYFEHLATELRRLPEISSRYARSKPKIWERLMMEVLLKMLDRFSKHDTGSKELLHFGCLVSAVKK